MSWYPGELHPRAPSTAMRTDSAGGVPEMVGTDGVSTPTATFAVTLLVLVTLVKPGLDPATVTVMVLPAWLSTECTCSPWRR